MYIRLRLGVLTLRKHEQYSYIVIIILQILMNVQLDVTTVTLLMADAGIQQEALLVHVILDIDKWGPDVLVSKKQAL